MTPGRDYPCRLIVPKRVWAAVLFDLAAEQEWSNFKNQAADCGPADQVLDDDQLLSTVYEALAKRRPKSRTCGRPGTPAEVVLRLLLLKHIRNWSDEVVEREVRANLVYRSFTRVGGGKVPTTPS